MDRIIFDLEATCWAKGTPGMSQEIIEIGAWRLDAYGHVQGSFHAMVRPVLHPVLSPYCLRLTKIGQEEVSRARHFPEVLAQFEDWLYHSEDFLLISWGAADRTLLRQDCDAHRMDPEWLDDLIDLKEVYREMFKLPRQIGLSAALRREGLEVEGEAHRALPDAKNLVRLFLKHRDQWPFL